MQSEIPKKRSLSERMRDRYRLVILNDSSFEEKFVLKLKPLSLFIGVGATIILLITFVIITIAFTPLREYIPGYADTKMRRNLVDLSVKSDSLEYELNLKTKYIENINNVISGNIKPDSIHNIPDPARNYKSLINTNKASKEDSILRDEVEHKEQFSLAVNNGKPVNNGISGFFFFTPLKGSVTSSFKAKDGHYGVDIVAKENEAIKATLDGTVIMAAWTTETGYSMQIQHSNNLISVYKHCSALMKKTGDFVKAGEVIAIVGNSGEQTTGPHLHFELWYNGNPIDPQDYMVF
jgi:murein DD-endopeptidase MepM/ murein hydrolase activator NlpD